MKRLEEEQQEFKDFLGRLRFARDRSEFDQFMAERRGRPLEHRIRKPSRPLNRAAEASPSSTGSEPQVIAAGRPFWMGAPLRCAMRLSASRLAHAIAIASMAAGRRDRASSPSRASKRTRCVSPAKPANSDRKRRNGASGGRLRLWKSAGPELRWWRGVQAPPSSFIRLRFSQASSLRLGKHVCNMTI